MRSQRCAKSSRVRPSPTSLFLPFRPSEVNSDLMAENHTLRGLLRSLSAFIGEGAGGVLPKLGWTLNDFEEYVNRAETDTAWESYQKHKDDRQNGQGDPSTSQTATGSRKRSADNATSSRNKRQRSTTADVELSNDTPVLGNPVDGSSFSDLLRTSTNASPLFMNPQNATSQAIFPTAPGSVPFTSTGSGSTPSFLHGLGLDSPPNGPSDPIPIPLPPPRAKPAPTTMAENPEGEEVYDPKFQEAGKLIGYVHICFPSRHMEIDASSKVPLG